MCSQPRLNAPHLLPPSRRETTRIRKLHSTPPPQSQTGGTPWLMRVMQLADAKKEKDDEASAPGDDSDDSSKTSSSSSSKSTSAPPGSDGGVSVKPAATTKVEGTKKRRRESDAAKNAPIKQEGMKPKKNKKAAVEESSDSDDTSSSSSESESEAEVANDTKKKQKTKKAKNTKKNEKPAIEAAEQWNVGGLEGGSLRQSKFMRLLGGGKKGGASTSGPITNTKSDSIKAEADIQRQFEAGMKAKAEGTGQRRGLGA